MRGSGFEEANARSLRQLLFEVGHVCHANHGLIGKAFDLRAQHRGLKLAQPVVETNRPMVKFIGHAGPPALM